MELVYRIHQDLASDSDLPEFYANTSSPVMQRFLSGNSQIVISKPGHEQVPFLKSIFTKVI